MISKALLSLVAAVAATGSAPERPKREPMIYLQCDLNAFVKYEAGKDNQVKTVNITRAYGFRERPPSVVDVYYPKIALQIVGVTENIVEFNSNNAFDAIDIYSKADSPSKSGDVVSYGALINRLTGSIDITFYPKYGPAEIAACRRAGDGPWCEFRPVTANLTGTCRQAARRF